MKKSLLVLFCILCFCITGCGYKEENVDIENVSGDLNGLNEELIGESDADIEAVPMDKEVEDSNTGKNVTIISKIEPVDLEYDWELELNKHPLEEKILRYDGKYKQGNQKNTLKIYFTGYDYSDYIKPCYEVFINDIPVDAYGFENGICIEDTIYIADLDDSDEYIELMTSNYWENGVNTSIYRYINDKLIWIGYVTDDIEYFVNYDGKFLPSYNVYHLLEETLIPRYYIIEEGKIIHEFTKYDEVKDKTYTVTQEFLDEIDCHGKLQVGDKIKILSLNDESNLITGGSQGVVMRVINEKGEIFEIGYLGAWA